MSRGIRWLGKGYLFTGSKGVEGPRKIAHNNNNNFKLMRLPMSGPEFHVTPL